MKKILLAAGLIAAVAFSGMARDNYSRNADVLPTVAQELLKKNFKADVSFVKEEKSMGRISEYEVVLTDGTEVTFDAKGNWRDVEASAKRGVPESMVPAAIAGYVKQNHKNTVIVSIDKERNHYDVELSNGIDIVFDANGTFVRYD